MKFFYKLDKFFKSGFHLDYFFKKIVFIFTAVMLHASAIISEKYFAEFLYFNLKKIKDIYFDVIVGLKFLKFSVAIRYVILLLTYLFMLLLIIYT